MPTLRLARIAAEAEGVRLRSMATRTAARLIYAVIALFFVLGALIFAHIAAWDVVRTGLNRSVVVTAGMLGGADLVLALVMGLLASRSRPSRSEIEASNVRRQALAGISQTAALAQIALALVRLLSNLARRRRD